MRLLSGHILPRNAPNFTYSHLDLKKNFPGAKTPEPLLTGAGKGKNGGEGVIGFLPLKVEERTRG